MQGRPFTYPWDRWLNPEQTKPRTLRAGKDFECEQHSMNINIRRMAYNRNLQVSLSNNYERGTITIESIKTKRRKRS